MAEATISSKNQIVIPLEARKALKVKAGDKILVTVYDHKMIIIEKPKVWSTAIRGIGKGVYPLGYLKKERRSWD